MHIHASVRYVLEAARWAPSADNSQPWRLTWDGKTLAVGYDAPRAENATFASENPATLVAMGALLENVLQAAAATEIGLERLAHSTDEYFRLRISPGPSSSEGRPDHPLFLRHTNRLPVRADPLPPALSDALTGHCQGAARVVVLAGTQNINSIARLVGDASAIRFRTREINEWLGRSLRFTPREVDSADGLDVATLNLPPGGRGLLRVIADWRRMEKLNRLGAYKLLAAIEAKSVANASAVVAIVGSGDSNCALDAGQLIERVWIDINRQGLAVQPFYVVADQLFRRDEGVLPQGLESRGDALASATEGVFGLAGQKLYMLLRIGYPIRTPIKSRRLPLATICET